LIFETTLLLDSKEITYREHFVCLIKDKHFNVVSAESTAVLDHVQNTSGGADDNMDTFLKNPDIFTDNSTSDTGVALKVNAEYYNPPRCSSDLQARLQPFEFAAQVLLLEQGSKLDIA
jgi:hypothetical protein